MAHKRKRKSLVPDKKKAKHVSEHEEHEVGHQKCGCKHEDNSIRSTTRDVLAATTGIAITQAAIDTIR